MKNTHIMDMNEKQADVAVNDKQAALADKITRLVNEYIENFDRFDSNPQIRINPATLAASLVNGRDMAAAVEDSDEAVEDAAAAEGLETEDAADFQAAQNPVFVAVKSLLKTTHSGTVVPSAAAIVAAARM